jgi:hypothetical protein
MLGNYDPAALDVEQLEALFTRYAGDRGWTTEESGWTMRGARGGAVDDWAALEVESEADLVDLFVPRFFFGCEADDPMTSMAFNTQINPFGARLGAMLGSDIGHWDVPDMTEVLPEVLEPLDKGWIGSEDLRDFVFTNPVRFYTDTNPDFFVGTAIEDDVRSLLAKDDRRES